MPRTKRQVVSTDPHTLRLIQQVAPGTPGAYHDPIFGAYWLATPRKGPKQGLNGPGGYVEIENSPVLNDASEFTLTLADTGSDGRSHRDRLYLFTDTPDPQNPGQTVPYMPGDEWIEIVRGNSELVQNGTPINETSQPGHIQITCRDALEILLKQRETAAGFWNHAPRDVFEHYTRAWKTIAASNFPGGSVPASGWRGGNVQAATLPPLTLIAAVGVGNSAYVRATGPPDAGYVDHSCWRAEARISTLTSSTTSTITLRAGFINIGSPAIPASGGIAFQIAPATGAVTVTTPQWGGGTNSWAVNAAGLLDANGQMQPPYTLAIEARERYLYFYLDGQLVAVANRPYPDAAASSTAADGYAIELNIASANMTATVDYMVVRKTTPPLNGGQAGDYQLSGPPDPGGLNGEYFDMTSSQTGALVPNGSPTLTPAASRVDGGVYFAAPASGVPGWFPTALGASTGVFIRWTGSIYLPLADQDIHFTIPAQGSADAAALWVGRTRKGEAICTRNQTSEFSPGFGETSNTTSVGLRSLLGSKNGWYPIIFEYQWASGSTGAHNVGFTYDVGGAGSIPAPTVLSPSGCMTQQIPNGDSHYDTLQTTIAQAFAMQFKSEPRQLESGYFPAAIIPRVRVGRDTDYVLDETEANNPQETTKAEDNATTTITQAQGLGGSSSGTLVAEAFNYPVMASHPFVLTEADSLPGTGSLTLLILQLATLLGLRSTSWQSVSADTLGQRHMQDTFRLTGALAEFDWQPGDGLRVNLPNIGVVDITPRQIFTLKRMLYQDGMGANTASFRDRPRNFEHALRRFIRQMFTQQRQFQGQLAYAPAIGATAPADSIAVLPADLSLIRQAELLILTKSDSSSWNVYVNGVATGQTVTGVGAIDISQSIARHNVTEPQMLAHLAGGTGSATYTIRLLELIPKA